MKSDYDYNRWYAQAEIIDAIRALALANPNTSEETKIWANRIIPANIEKVGRPTLFTRQIKSKAQKYYGKTYLVALFSNGEFLTTLYREDAEKIIKWFDSNYPL